MSPSTFKWILRETGVDIRRSLIDFTICCTKGMKSKGGTNVRFTSPSERNLQLNVLGFREVEVFVDGFVPCGFHLYKIDVHFSMRLYIP